MAQGESVEKERRNQDAARRKTDKELRAVKEALDAHVLECSENYLALKHSVDKVVEWAEPQIEKSKARAAIWSKASETVQTDGVVFLMKAVIVVTLASVAYGIVPAARALVEHLLKAFLGS